MKITIEGYFENYCQDCPELDLVPSINFDIDNPNYICKNNGLCAYLLKRLKENMEEEIEDEIEKKVVGATYVVHCEDCKHLYFKDLFAYCPYFVSQCKPNGFCNHGEKK